MYIKLFEKFRSSIDVNLNLEDEFIINDNLTERSAEEKWN